MCLDEALTCLRPLVVEAMTSLEHHHVREHRADSAACFGHQHDPYGLPVNQITRKGAPFGPYCVSQSVATSTMLTVTVASLSEPKRPRLGAPPSPPGHENPLGSSLA